jgi:hypothetical protein
VYATMLLESYHLTSSGVEKPKDILLNQFIDLLMHYPPEALRRMVSPYEGLPGLKQWKPSLAETKAFLDNEVARMRSHRDAARARLAPPKPIEAVPPEERERRARALEEIARVARLKSINDPIHKRGGGDAGGEVSVHADAAAETPPADPRNSGGAEN